MNNLTPRQIVAELDKYIIGQHEAKKSVAIALRNRYRRKKLPSEIQDEIVPKNIIMIGPTGVGKTEIARRLAKLVKAPFIKVEATKYTEVGYVGRDVESMVRDLVETSIRMVRQEKTELLGAKAEKLAEEIILDIISNKPKQDISRNPFEFMFGNNTAQETTPVEDDQGLKDKIAILKQKLERKELEEELIEIEINEQKPSMIEVFTGTGMEEMGVNLQDMLDGVFPKKKKKRKISIAEARKIIAQEEAEKLIDMDEVITIAVKKAEQDGIIFLDEIDKLAGKNANGPDVSRGGVQRDILPIVEGSTIMTKYGPVKTDYMLFIAAGAFHVSKPSDLIPELQGRFPIRVELTSLEQADFEKILTVPKNSLIKQYVALLSADNLQVEFSENAIKEIADFAYRVNAQTENIGARRLHTILEKILSDLFFDAPDIDESKKIIDKEYVRSKLENIVKNEDLSRYIL